MVDVSGKAETARAASADCSVLLKPGTVKLLKSKKLAKGDAITTAKVAGILAAKRVPELIPLTHPLKITLCEIEFLFGKPVKIRASRSSRAMRSKIPLRIESTVRTKGQTGPDIEALTAAAVAALTIYDMVKAVDREAEITSLRLIEKSGGKSGHWKR